VQQLELQFREFNGPLVFERPNRDDRESTVELRGGHCITPEQHAQCPGCGTGQWRWLSERLKQRGHRSPVH